MLKLEDLSKSINSAATGHNSGRRIVRDSSPSGPYHAVFASGGEITYRKWAGVWQTPVRLTSGNGSNNYPSLTERGGKVFITWQRKNGSTHDIWFHRSDDDGATWPSANRKTVATSVGSSDPLPVITSHTTNNLVVVYRKTNDVQSKHSTNNGDSWPTTKSFTGITLNSPSVTNVDPGSPKSAVTNASGDGHVYYRYYDGSSWTGGRNLSSIVPGTAAHQTPSISCEGTISQSLHAAWHRSTGGSGFGNTIIYRKSTDYTNWPSQYTQIYYQDQQKPTITAFSSNSVDVIFQSFTANQIYKQHFNGSSWGGPTFISNGQYPSVSTGNGNAKYVWTSSGSSPYTLSLSSETLSKETSGEPYYERQISWMDSSGAHLTMRLKSLSLKTSKGEWYRLTLQPVALDTVSDFGPANAFDFLVLTPSLLPADAESLVVDFTLWAENAEKVGFGSSPRISLEFKSSGEQSLTKVLGPEFRVSGTIAETARRLAVPLTAVKQTAGSNNVKAVVKIEGLTPKV